MPGCTNPNRVVMTHWGGGGVHILCRTIYKNEILQKFDYLIKVYAFHLKERKVLVNNCMP